MFDTNSFLNAVPRKLVSQADNLPVNVYQVGISHCCKLRSLAAVLLLFTSYTADKKKNREGVGTEFNMEISCSPDV